ncbi:MAG: hypothetical protein ACKO96_36200 [Flammeovirgaceae bacterium]
MLEKLNKLHYEICQKITEGRFKEWNKKENALFPVRTTKDAIFDAV